MVHHGANECGGRNKCLINNDVLLSSKYFLVWKSASAASYNSQIANNVLIACGDHSSVINVCMNCAQHVFVEST